jgi:hypothetical protein
MAYSYQQILESQYQRIAEEQSQAAADLEAGRISEDAYRVTGAADRILELDKTREALDRRANQYIASQQQQPQGNQYGLSQSEVEIARGISSGDSSLTNAERERIYAANKNKLRHMRQTGEYRDDQATQVRR